LVYKINFKKGGRMKLKPLRERVIVKRIEEEEKTPGGIIIPDSAKEKPQLGIVISSGPGRVLKNGKVLPTGVKKGDRVVFPKFAGAEIKIKGEEHLIISEDEILGIVEEGSGDSKKKK